MAGVFNHLWESTLFALVAALATLAFRNNGAHVRYWLWFAASVKFLIPFSLLTAIGRLVGPQTPPLAAPETVTAVMQTLSAPAVIKTIADMADSRHVTHGVPGTVIAATLMTAWACGVAAVLLLWTMKWLRIGNALWSAAPADIDAPIPVKTAPTLLEPGIVGVFRPVLLLPEGIAEYLTPQQLRAVMAHELCHLRRRDNLTAAIHMVVQAVFWFHPLIWWIGTRLVAERERACDEAVIKSSGDSETYAEGIIKVCKFYVESPLMATAGVSGANLKTRIERIMMGRDADGLGAAKRLLLCLVAMTLIIGPIVTGLTSARGAALPPKAYWDLPAMVVNINTPGYFLKFQVSLDVACARKCDENDFNPIERVQPSIIDSFQEYVRGLSLEDLQGRPGTTLLRTELLSRVNALIPPAHANNVLFKEMIVTDKP